MQNSLHDIRSLIQFLRIPYLKDTPVFQKYIAETGRMKKGFPRLKPAYENLKLLLGSICLRRSISSLSLGVIFLFERPRLSEVERKAYADLEKACKRSIHTAVSGRRAAHGNRDILTALLRLRIFCNTGLATFGETGEDAIKKLNPDEINSLLQQSGELPVCVACSCDMLSFGTNDVLHQELPNLSKCEDCIQLVTASHSDGRTFQDQHSPTHNMESQSLSLSKEDSGSSRICDISRYPSKLKAVLSDIMEHQFTEKR